MGGGDQGRPGSMGGGGQGRPGGDIEQMIAAECPTFDCTGVVKTDVDCSIEKPMNKTEGSRPDFMNMTDAEKEEFKIEMNAKKEERRQKILECACCTDSDSQDLLAKKEGTSTSIFGSGRPEMGVSHPSGGEDGGSVSGRPWSSGKTIQDALDEKCPDFDCASVDEESVDCTRFDIMTNQRRSKNILFCGCCRELNDVSEVASVRARPGRGDSQSMQDGTSASGMGGRPGGMTGGSQSQEGADGAALGGMQGSVGGSESEGGSSGRPGAGGSGGSGIDIQSLLAEKCPSFDCLGVDSESVDCSRFGSMTGRERRRSGVLFCGCCVDNQDEDDLALFLVSALNVNSEIISEEVDESNPASRVGAVSAFAVVATGAVFMLV